MFICNPKNYKCGSPNCPPIHVFTLKVPKIVETKGLKILKNVKT